MRKILLVIDMQNDFIDGSLGTAEAQAIVGNVIEKIRYRIPESDGLTIELDIFQGIFDGLKIAEIEFKDLKQANEYQPPVWFGPEVTHDHRYHNVWMAGL